jgi:hypothetical protein
LVPVLHRLLVANCVGVPVSILDAWRHWLAGDKIDENKLVWGLRLLWWGRVGKLMQFGAALAIVVEIVGPKRLRDWGNSLRSAVPLDRVKALWNYVKNWFVAWMKFAVAIKPGSAGVTCPAVSGQLFL